MFFFLSFFSFSLFLSFSGLTLFVKTTERTVTECLKFSLSRKRLTQAFRRLSATRITKLSNFIIHPRAFVLLVRLWTGQSIEHGSGKRRNVGTFSSIDILCRHRRRMDSISFLINQFHCDIFEGSYPRREFKSVKDISFDARRNRWKRDR